MRSLQAYIPSPVEFFGLDQTKLPNYAEQLLLDQIVLNFTLKEAEDKNSEIIFISRLQEKFQSQINQNSNFVFDYRFENMTEELLTKMLFMHPITEKEFDANSSFIEIMYKSYLLKTAIQQLEIWKNPPHNPAFPTCPGFLVQTLFSYFTEQDHGQTIRLNLWRVEDNQINALFLTDVFYDKEPLSQPGFSYFLKYEIIKRCQYLGSQPADPINPLYPLYFGQFIILNNICAWLAT